MREVGTRGAGEGQAGGRGAREGQARWGWVTRVWRPCGQASEAGRASRTRWDGWKGERFRRVSFAGPRAECEDERNAGFREWGRTPFREFALLTF